MKPKRVLAYARQGLSCLVWLVAGSFEKQVVWGHPPSTDGKTVFMPNFPLEYTAIPKPFRDFTDCEAIAEACAYHEGGHCRYTDFSSQKRVAIKKQGGLAEQLYQGIEDTRMERCAIRDRRGAQRKLAKGVQVMVEIGMVRQDLEKPANVFSQFVDSWGRIHVNGQTAIEPLFLKFRSKLAEILDEYGLSRVEALLSSRLRQLQSTDDSCVLAQELVTLLQELDEEEQKKQEQEKGANESPCENGGNGAGEPDESDGDAGGQPTESSEDEEGGDQGAQAPGKADAGDGSDAGKPDKADSTSSPDASTGSAKGAGKEAGKTTGAAQILGDQDVASEPLVDLAKATQMLADGEGEVAPPPYEPKLLATEDLTQYHIVVSAIRSGMATLRNRLVNFFLAKQFEDVEYTTKGRLCGSRLARIAVGDYRVFSRTVEHEELDTALTIVVDDSGSMHGSRGVEAQKMMTLVAEVASRVNVALEILGFDSGPENVFAIKPFDIPYKASRGRIGGYIEAAGGGTELGHALLQGAYRLLGRPESRKILFAFTDGETSDVSLTRAAVDFMSRRGIEVIAFGIESRAVENHFPRHVIIDNAENLGTEVLRILKQQLKRAA